MLMTMEDGRLGVARAEGPRLSVWSVEASPHGDMRWTHIKVIEHKKLLPTCAIDPGFVVFAHDIGIFFVAGGDGLFSIDLKSDRVRKLSEESCILGVIPYMGFYTPEIRAACAVDGRGVGESSA